MKQVIQKALMFIVLLVSSAIAIIRIEDYAYIYVSVLWLITLGVFAKRTKLEKSRLAAIYLGAMIMAFFLAEVYFSGILGFRYQVTSYEHQVISGGHNEPNDVLGLSPVPNSKWSVKSTYADSVVFDAIQTIDSNGLRYTPGKVADNAQPILFLGCSFTFGSGLNDYQTLPYYFQAQDSGRFKAINMGYNGYGAHQTLALLEAGMEQKVLEGQKPKAGIYTAITDHIFRGTGRFGETFGPIYKLKEGTRLKKTKISPYYISKLYHYLGKSYLLSRFVFRKSQSKPSEVELILAIIEKSALVFSERYDAPFYVLLWEEKHSEPGLYDKMLRQLNRRGLNVIEVKNILPGYEEKPDTYALYEDNHPNHLANELIAEYLYKFIEQ